jgi:hypothetical protein
VIHGVGQKHAALLSSKVHAGTGHALLILSQRSIVRAALLVPGPLLAQHPLLHLLPHLLQLLWRAEVAVLAVLRLQATLFEPPLPQAQAPQPLPFLFLPSLLPVHSLVVHEQQTQCLRGLWLDSPIPCSKHILLYLVRWELQVLHVRLLLRVLLRVLLLLLRVLLLRVLLLRVLLLLLRVLLLLLLRVLLLLLLLLQ